MSTIRRPQRRSDKTFSRRSNSVPVRANKRLQRITGKVLASKLGQKIGKTQKKVATFKDPAKKQKAAQRLARLRSKAASRVNIRSLNQLRRKKVPKNLKEGMSRQRGYKRLRSRSRA